IGGVARVIPDRIDTPIGRYRKCAEKVPLVMVDRIVIDPNRCAKGLAAIGAAGEHYVGPVAGTERDYTRQHVNVIICPGGVHGDECLSTKSYSIYAALNEVTAQINLSDNIKSRCLVSVLCIAGAKAPKRTPSSADKKNAVDVHVERTRINRI